MPDTTLRVKTQAELAQLKEVRREMRETRVEMEAMTEAVMRYNAAVGGGSGATPTSPGVPPVAPPPVVNQQAATPPAAPPPTQGAPSGGQGAVPQAPPPSGGGAGGGVGGGGGGPGFWTRDRSMSGAAMDLATRAGVPNFARAGGYLTGAAGIAAGIGLGGSALGFLLSSATKWQELSKVLTTLERRFESVGAAGENAATRLGTSGYRLGFTIAEMGQHVETLGSLTNMVTAGQAQSYLGFARFRGLDPGTAMSSLGGMQQAMGRQLTDSDMAAIAGRAGLAKMDRGRFGEFTQSIEALMARQLEQTGGASLEGAFGTSSLASQVFGDSELGKGMKGVGFTDRLGGVLSSGGPMRSFMMRAIGYGGSDMSYIDMRKRLEAGVTGEKGAQNLVDMFSYMKQSGMGKGDMFRGLESVAGGSLKAHEIESLVNVLGTDEGMAKFQAARTGGTKEGLEAFRSGLTEEQRAVFDKSGMYGLGQKYVPGGAGAAVQLEGMQMSVGGAATQGIMNLRDTITSLAHTFGNVFGEGFDQKVVKLTEQLSRAADGLDKMTSKGTQVHREVIEPAQATVHQITTDFGGAVRDAAGHYKDGVMKEAGADHPHGSKF